MPPSLSKQIALAADRAVSKNEALAHFAAIPDVSGMDVRRFYRASAGREEEICVYRDKWWTKQGGTVHVELFCLLESYQVAMAGMRQSWRKPRKDVQLHHFQHGPSAMERNPTWPIANGGDVQAFENGMSEWLSKVAIPWFSLFESSEGVISHLSRRGLHAHAARFLASLGRMAEARAQVTKYVSTLPRQADRELDALKKLGLLSEEESHQLSRASLQHIDRFKSFVDAWVANRGA